MVAPPTERAANSTPPRRARSSWSSGLQGIVLVAALMALDLLPLYALLLVAAGSGAGSVRRVALPFSYLAAASAICALVGHLVRHLPLANIIAAGIVVGGALWLVAIAISPATCSSVPGGVCDANWLSADLAYLDALASGSAPISALVALGLVVLFLVWRGMFHSLGEPDLDSVLTLFKISLCVLVFAAILAVGLRPGDRAEVNAALAFLVPLAVFAGLVAAALSAAAASREELPGADLRTAGGERWLGMAIVLSGGVVLLGLLASAILTYGSLGAALAQLGPVGEGLNALVEWLILAFAGILFFLLGPLINALQSIANRTPPTPQGPSGVPQTASSPSVLPEPWVHITQIVLTVLVVLLVLLIAVLVLRMLTGAQRARLNDSVEEEREALDGASLLRAQLRSLLGRLGQRTPSEVEESLPSDSIRTLYRELLQVAADRGIGRRGSETPDEYGRRLNARLHGVAPPSEVATISEAYDEARYGEREPAGGERRTMREQVKRVLATIKHMPQ
jgi:hypothetical protein